MQNADALFHSTNKSRVCAQVHRLRSALVAASNRFVRSAVVTATKIRGSKHPCTTPNKAQRTLPSCCLSIRTRILLSALTNGTAVQALTACQYQASRRKECMRKGLGLKPCTAHKHKRTYGWQTRHATHKTDWRCSAPSPQRAHVALQC